MADRIQLDGRNYVPIAEAASLAAIEEVRVLALAHEGKVLLRAIGKKIYVDLEGLRHAGGAPTHVVPVVALPTTLPPEVSPVAAPLSRMVLPPEQMMPASGRSFAASAAATLAFVLVIGGGLAAYKNVPDIAKFVQGAGSQLAAAIGFEPTVTYRLQPAPRAVLAVDSPSQNQAVATGATFPSSTATTTQPIYYVYNYPVIERVVETTRLVAQGGITEDILDRKLVLLDQNLSSRLLASSVSQTTNVTNVYAAAASVGRIEHLDALDLTNPVITNGTITGTSITNAGSLSVAGATSLATTTVTGDLTVTGAVNFTGSPFSATDATFTNATTTNSTSTNLYSSSLVAGNATSTNFFATNASTTNATSTNLFSVLSNFTTTIISTLTAAAATITDLVATTISGTNLTYTNATTTNATSTNLFSTNASFGTLSVAGASTFTGLLSTTNASTSLLSVFQKAYFGATATSTFDSAGNLFAAGTVGIGTTSPFRKLSITDAVATAQVAVSYDATRNTDLLTDSAGDLAIDPSGDDVRINDDNLWVCSSGSCPSGTPAGTGNLIVETALGVGTSSPSQQLGVAGMLWVGANGATGMGTATSTFYGDILIAGKLDVGTIDPVYTIDGMKFATYGHSTVGIKEEVVLKVVPAEWDTKKNMYVYRIDFDSLEKGSDLWLFYQVTDLGKNWENLVVTLSRSFDGSAFYEEDAAANEMRIYASESGSVSLRLIANRFDFSKWGNLRPDQDGDTTGTHVITSKPTLTAPVNNIFNATSETQAVSQ